MARFEIKQSSKLQLTSYSGLALVGQCCQIAQVDAVIDPRIPALPQKILVLSFALRETKLGHRFL